MLSLSKVNSLKLLLIIIGAIIVFATIYYSNFLANNLKKSEEKTILLYKDAIDRLLIVSEQESYDEAYFEFLAMVNDSFPLPVIFEDENGHLEGFNFGPNKDQNAEFLQKKVEEFLDEGNIPKVGSGYATNIYFFNSAILGYITWFPLIQGLLISSYIGLGYLFFNASRNAQQNRVWAGLAKETAHQLGTPLSAIIGWVEYLKEYPSIAHDQMEVIGELEKDVNRLELVADRFSKIGSEPVLHSLDIYNELLEVKDYLARRAPKKVNFAFSPPKDIIHVMINKHLFAWVIENLIRNSLDAMNGQGTIKCEVYKQNNYVVIELSDTGHGIPTNKFKTIFQPGYSTKKRGWGLGLSLAKRIVEEYHKGKIFVKSSKPNDCTVFAIKLPLTT